MYEANQKKMYLVYLQTFNSDLLLRWQQYKAIEIPARIHRISNFGNFEPPLLISYRANDVHILRCGSEMVQCLQHR